MNVAIVGAGMIGHLAAKACLDNDIYPQVFSRDGGAPGYGVRYLHDACGLRLNPIEIETAFYVGPNDIRRFCDVDLEEMAGLYAKKTGASRTNNSVHRSVEKVKAYNWYDAWDLLQGLRVNKIFVNNSFMKRLSREFDLVVNTAPLWTVYPKASRQCKCREMYVSGGAPIRYMDELTDFAPNVIVYNVMPNIGPEGVWTRYSRIGNVDQTEWLEPVVGSHPVVKVNGQAKFGLRPHNVMLVGRYGAWDATYMAHQAYYDVLDRIKEM